MHEGPLVTMTESTVGTLLGKSGVFQGERPQQMPAFRNIQVAASIIIPYRFFLGFSIFTPAFLAFIA